MDVVRSLAACPVLSNLSDSVLVELAGKSKVRHVKSGAIIYERQTYPDCLTVLASGQVTFSVLNADGKQAIIWRLQATTWFGGDVFSPGLPRVFRSSAHTDVSLIEVPGKNFRVALRDNPDAAMDALSGLGRRTWAFMCLAEDDRIHDTKVRLLRRLVLMAEYAAPSPLDSASPEFEMTQDDLAQILGMTRQGIRSALKELESLGLMDLSYKKVSLRSLSRIRKFLQDEADIVIPQLTE